jgi:hypothetical protein
MEIITHAMYLRPAADPETFFPAAQVYYSDIVYFEPELLRMYDEVLPQIHRVLQQRLASAVSGFELVMCR